MTIIRWFNRPAVLWLSGLLILIVGVLLYWNLRPERSLLPSILPARSAYLTLDYPRRTPVQQPFDFVVRLNTLNNKVNAVGLTLRFDPQTLQVVDMDTRDSFCQFYPERNFDNSLGQVTLACGSPHPGFTGENPVLRLSLLPTGVGQTRIYMSDESEVLLSDGTGTNVLEDFEHADIQITNTL